MVQRSIEFVQPYQVGQKNKKSLAVIIPAKIARQCNITPETLFSVRANMSTKAVTLQTVKLTTEDENENKKAGAAVEATHLTATTL
jgi:heterodisulfide reductase subunit A-like polyferredoxin